MRENGGLNFYRNLMKHEVTVDRHEARGDSGPEQDGSQVQELLLFPSGLQVPQMLVCHMSLWEDR